MSTLVVKTQVDGLHLAVAVGMVETCGTVPARGHIVLRCRAHAIAIIRLSLN